MRISLKSALPFILGGMLISSLYSCGGGDKDKDKDKDKDNYAQTSACGCEKSWFPHSQTPAPKEGKQSPFDTTSTTNCMFHQWSWQKFLWLTKQADANALPFFLQKGKEADNLTQIDANMAAVTIPEGANVLLDDSLQAGGGGILRTASNYAGKNYTVHYAIYANKIMLDAAKIFKPKIINGKDSTNLDAFPVGSLELKTSWVQIGAIREEDRNKYFVTMASINGGKPEKVAFLGMHVVGRVINHPEFIWATFEHERVAPNFDWAKTTSSQDAPIVAESNMLLFNAPQTAGFGGITWQSGTVQTPNEAYTLYKYGVPKVAGGDFMTGIVQDGKTEHDNMETINACVKKNLDDVWANYFYNGSIWLNTDGTTPDQQAKMMAGWGGKLGTVGTDTLLRGSLAAFNISMETFVQADGQSAHQMTAANLTNCFSCHASAHTFNGKKKTSPLFVSHIFNNYVAAANKASIGDAKANGARTYMELLQQRKQARK